MYLGRSNGHRMAGGVGGDVQVCSFAEFGGKETHVGSGAAGGAVEGGKVVEDGHKAKSLGFILSQYTGGKPHSCKILSIKYNLHAILFYLSIKDYFGRCIREKKA